jgi:hypothetical protein
MHTKIQVTKADVPGLLRRGALAVAAGRAAIGVTALAWPAVPSRPWVGAAADDLAARVFARALGARDLALGLGALTALQAQDASASLWVARWLVAGSAAGAALTGAAGALAVRTSRNGQPPNSSA